MTITGAGHSGMIRGADAARRAGVATSTVSRAVQVGVIAGYREGAALWVDAAHVDKYLRPRAKQPPLERIMPRVRKQDDGCWIYTGYLTPEGYGQVWDGFHRNAFAHRVVYQEMVGPIPTGLQLDHLCRVRSCCNPAHLEPVTQRVNNLRGCSPIADNIHKTHCPKGHPYNEANTYRRPDAPWHRDCRPCRAERARIARRAAKQDLGRAA